MVYELNYNLVLNGLFEKEQIAWENGTKSVCDFCSCCGHFGFNQTWGFCLKLSFSIYSVHLLWSSQGKGSI